MRTEYFWWFGIALWGLALVFWHPQPDTPYLAAPSASPKPPGYGIFHDMVASGTLGARRTLATATELPSDVGVLVLLSPSEIVPAKDRIKMLEWVEQTGGTLVLGHPILGDDQTELEYFVDDENWSYCRYRPLSGPRLATVDYVPNAVDTPRDIPPFSHPFHGQMDISDCDGVPLLLDEVNDVGATSENYGAGTIIQIASVDILDNEALGFKHAHLFAAALIDEAGRDTVWAFNEAYEGISPQPKYIQIVGASRFRPIFLQVILIVLLGYWWRTARLGKDETDTSGIAVRDVATQACDTGDFFRRAGKSQWALSRMTEYLKVVIKERRGTGKARDTAVEVLETSEKALAKKDNDMERHSYLIRKITIAVRILGRSSKGKAK